MTIPEAAQLVIQAGTMAQGGDVCVLDMGQPVKIMDLARRMIQLSGLTIQDESNPEGDIAIEVTGLRPGEKLYEELLIGNNPSPTDHPLIMKSHEAFIEWPVLELKLRSLEDALSVNNVGLVRQLLQDLLPEYSPTGEVVDWIYLAQQAN
jgi:FlaA1/EpsC-like NDP-sugar epimerase